MLLKTIETICKERGISIAKLEKESGLGNATVRGWDVSTPSVGTISKVADYLGVTIDYLLHYEQNHTEQ